MAHLVGVSLAAAADAEQPGQTQQSDPTQIETLISVPILLIRRVGMRSAAR